ncbi:IclR family transcriptional regulator C-terminal domain-containing protein [Streptomyces sp. NPDC088921]|uniref:IclR family transcriptional regulator domain-containing protein n=1 Tax=unclassified Streptomyces TaxID=2593676 RepID=UPI003432F1CF
MCGFVARDADRRVRSGMRLWELATRASPTLSLRNAAMPFMEGVHDVVGHHVQLGVLHGDEALFPDTPATAARLRAVLADVRQQGYVYCPGYVHPDALGVAAPVRDARGEVVAALAVIVPNESGASSVVSVVRTAAHGISRALGAPAATAV